MRCRTSYLLSLPLPKALREFAIRRGGSLFVFAMLLSVIPACRRAAFNEFYVESMASEIRALEDRIYEYDSAYQSLEMENEDLRAKHERLQRKLRELEEQDSLNLQSKPSRSTPRDSKPKQDAIDSETFELVPPPKVKVEEPAPIVPRTPASPPADLKSDKSDPATESSSKDSPSSLPSLLPGAQPSILPGQTPAPTKESVEPSLPKAEPVEILPAPLGNSSTSNPMRSRRQSESKANELVEEYTMPPAIIRSAQQPNGANLLQPPLLNQSESNTAPRMPTLPGTSPGAIIQGRIKVPFRSDVVQASATEVLTPDDSTNSHSDSITDRRVVSIDFHPILCRGINLDNTPGDDGLYLVVTPKNQLGQTINEEGKLTIVAEETINDESVRISAWEIDPNEMKEYLEPIGAAQGYHLRLPWQGTGPSGRTVHVFMKCEFEDGRKPVNRKEVTLSKSNNRPLTWSPRQ